MELNQNFLAGLSCGLCLGISYYVLRTYIRGPTEALSAVEVKKPVKKFTSKSEYKMVLVVRNDLNMTKGKIMSQCCHAAVGAFEELQRTDLISLRIWQNTGQAKVAVKSNSLEEVLKIAEEAESKGVVLFKVFDVAKTEDYTLTCLAVGPAPKDVIDKITGHLKLL